MARRFLFLTFLALLCGASVLAWQSQATRYYVQPAPISHPPHGTARAINAALPTRALAAPLPPMMDGCATPSFAAATSFDVGHAPTSVVVGDFNGDGKPDLATANHSSHTVSVLLGTGTGSFGTASNFPTEAYPFSMAAGDFNADGKLDLAITNSQINASYVSVLLGTGTGSFGAPTNFPAGTDPVGVAVGDFNADGKLDLAIANANTDYISVLLGTGTGSFSAATRFPAGDGPSFVAVSDFNADGKLDLAVANTGSNNVSVLLGNGAGSFSAPTNFRVQTIPLSVAVGDFNRDGKLDLAVANRNDSNVSVLLGTGTGSFSAATNFNIGELALSVAVGDFNGDGKLDLVANGWVLLGTGTGSFGAAIRFATLNSVAVGDFNGDGKLDLAGANSGADNVSVLLNDCTVNQIPTITSLDPPSTYNTLPDFILTVKGTGFVGPNGSVVRWNGSDRPTTFVSSTELKAAIGAADILNVGTSVVTVFNPPPGGGTSNAVNFAIEKLTGYEGDVSPRPLGNNDGKVTIQDWVQVGRFFARLDKPESGSEFQRADCAPKETKGDGRLSITDWVQAGRYAAGLDVAVVAGGPIQPTAAAPTIAPTTEAFAAEAQRIVRAANTNFRRDQVNTLRIELEALGDENALAFSLNFDPRLLNFADAALGDGAAGAVLSINRTKALIGRIGIAMAMPVGQSFVAGTRSILIVGFIPIAGEDDTTTQISFNDSLVPCELSNAFAQPLSKATYSHATILLTGRAAAHVSAANYVGGELAADSIASAFGSNLALSTEGASTATLPITLAGTRVQITDRQGTEVNAPLFFVSPYQINYQIPAGLAEGIATVTITNRDGLETKGLLKLSQVAPGVFSADASGKGLAAAEVVYIRSDNTQVKERVAWFDAAAGRSLANPIEVGNDPVYLTLYGTGLRNRSSLSNITARIDGIDTSVEYAGAQGQFFGLDQINVRLPKSLAGRGEVSVEVSVDSKAANLVKIQIR